jgi:ankyrin repeat protein
MNDLLFASNLTEESLKFLIASGADINAKNIYGKTPLYCASYKDNFNLVKILIENGADKNYVSWDTTDEIQRYLVEVGCPATEKLIIKFGTQEQKEKCKISFEDVVGDFNISKLKIYVSNGGDINKQKSSGLTLLHIAVYENRLDCVKFLVENGADQTIKDNEGRVPARIGTTYYEIYSILRDNINEKSNDGNTRMHIAARNDNFEQIRYLCSIGARFDIVNNEGKTAVDYCSRKDIFKTREEMLKEFVNGDIKWAVETILG